MASSNFVYFILFSFSFAAVFVPNESACNYGKGRWVADKRRPLYSGFGCKQWLSPMWACRLTTRPDFTYEGYRWQPTNCDMPDFQSTQFLRRMQGKTIAFIGDSLGREQFQSLMCMITGGEERPEVENMEKKFGLAEPPGATRPGGWAYRFPNTNTTILFYWSATLCDEKPINISNPTTEIAVHLDQPPAFLKQYLPQFDVVVLDTAHHWNKGEFAIRKLVMYANGKPVTDRKLAQMENALNYTRYSIARWLDSQISLHPQLKVFLTTTSPRHGRCDNLTPLLHGFEVTPYQPSDPSVEAAVNGTKVKILDITALSQLRDEGHISRYTKNGTKGRSDCLHWCLPGIPDTWNELLYAQL